MYNLVGKGNEFDNRIISPVRDKIMMKQDGVFNKLRKVPFIEKVQSGINMSKSKGLFFQDRKFCSCFISLLDDLFVLFRGVEVDYQFSDIVKESRKGRARR